MPLKNLIAKIQIQKILDKFLVRGLQAFLIVTIICVIVPFTPLMPTSGLDPSWQYGMNQALAQRMNIGSDVIFTFGPYASIYTKTYHPATDSLMLFGALYFTFSYTLGLLILIKKDKWFLAGGFSLFLAGTLVSYDALYFSYPLLASILCINKDSLYSKYKFQENIAPVKIIIFLFPLGLLPLIKGSFLLISASAVALVAISYLLNKNWFYTVIALITPIISAVVFWNLSGQDVIGIYSYLKSLAPIISGYTEAMSVHGESSEIFLYIFAACSLLFVFYWKTDKVLHHHSLILLSFAAYLFIAFKGGFVRHDGHAQIAGIAIVISTFLLAFSFRSTHTSLLITLSICTWGYIDNNYTKTSTDQLVSRISSTYISAWRGAKNRLIDNDGLKIKFNEELKSLNAQKNFPVLNGTTDIYSYDQALLIASGNTWNPRPIFQSYSVYTPELAEINKKHLLSDKAPNNIFFKIEPIDNRLPALEDGASWPTLLTEYSLTTQSNGYLYLRHKENHLQPNEETFVRSGTYFFGDFVPVPSGDSPIFAELTVTSSLIGRLIGILYKPAQLQIELQLKNGKTTTYRLISGMAKSGFIVNPLIESTDEFGLLYGGLNYLNNKSVKSFSISQINSTHQWNNTYEVTFKKIKSNQQGDISKIFEFNKFTENSLKDNISLVKRCDGTIDTLNGTSPLIKSTVNKLIRARGWLAKSAENGAVGDSIFLVLRDSTGKFKLISTKKVMRPDVGAHFKNSALDSSGFESIAIMEAASGDYTLGLAYTEGDKVMVCTQFNFPIHVDN